MSTIVAIPTFQDAVAPCFEAARSFALARISQGNLRSVRLADCSGCEGFGRVQLLRDVRTTVLICNGIKAFYRDLLQAAGITVVSHVSADVSDALRDFLHGQLVADAPAVDPVDLWDSIPLEDLMCWTQELFTSNGYTVSRAPNFAPFPIDMIAEIRCPGCGKPIRVAICCGAHMYRADQEIQLFHRNSAASFNARVYVRPATQSVARQCQEFGIDLIDPDDSRFAADRDSGRTIPLLRAPVAGHEAAVRSSGTQEKRS